MPHEDTLPPASPASSPPSAAVLGLGVGYGLSRAAEIVLESLCFGATPGFPRNFSGLRRRQESLGAPEMTPRASLLGAEATTQGGRVNLATNKQFIKSVSNGLFLLSPAAPQPTPATTALPPSH